MSNITDLSSRLDACKAKHGVTDAEIRQANVERRNRVILDAVSNFMGQMRRDLSVMAVACSRANARMAEKLGVERK